MATELNKDGESHAESLIDAGKVDRDSAWSMSAADENALLGKDGADWDNYSKFHLGIKPDEAERTKAHYAYPHGKAGKVYRRALIAAESRAAQQGDDAIRDAAKRLLERIDAKGDNAEEEKKETPAEEQTEQESGEGDDKTSAARAAAPRAEGSALAAGFRDLPRIASRLFGTPLLIAPRKLAVIMRVIGPRFGAMDDEGEGPTPEELAAQRRAEQRSSIARIFGLADDDFEAGDDAPFVKTADGIAIVPVEGTLVYKSGWLGALSGLVSYSEIGQSLAAAVGDPSVKGILLSIDSYGGEVNGCFDLSDAIFAARQQKPVYAVAADEAYSAAYALASAAERLYVSRTSGVGSIGTVAAHTDWSGADKMDGLKVTYVHAGARKVDGNPHEPLSDPAREALQAECDRLQGIFAGAVAKYRGVSADSLIAMEAACVFGEEGVSAKLADAVGTPADALAGLRDEMAKRAEKNRGGGSMTMQPPAGGAAAASAGDKLVNLDDVRSKAASDATIRAVAIVELCKLAGKPDLAGDYIKRGLSEDTVRQQLQALKAEASDAHGISSHHGAAAGLDSQEGVSRLWDQVLLRGGFLKKA